MHEAIATFFLTSALWCAAFVYWSHRDERPDCARCMTFGRQTRRLQRPGHQPRN